MKNFLILFALLFGFSYANDFSIGLEALNKGDYKKAEIYFQKACDSGGVVSCTNLGIMYSKGDGVS